MLDVRKAISKIYIYILRLVTWGGGRLRESRCRCKRRSISGKRRGRGGAGDWFYNLRSENVRATWHAGGQNTHTKRKKGEKFELSADEIFALVWRKERGETHHRAKQDHLWSEPPGGAAGIQQKLTESGEQRGERWKGLKLLNDWNNRCTAARRRKKHSSLCVFFLKTQKQNSKWLQQHSNNYFVFVMNSCKCSKVFK